ncbi:MAG: alpha-E domain-containing protein, partial [Dechloromonas sp.]|nr:alpha-E domain-containing protein [Dechloromonas sp.]
MADSIITYRSRYSRHAELLPVIDLLVFDESNPHGVSFQTNVLGRYLERMASELGADYDQRLSGAVERLRAFDLGKLEHLQFNQCRSCAPCEELASLLLDLDAAAAHLSDGLAMRYFTHVGDVSRQTMAL